MEEIWKDIEGYETKYKISNLGNVKSLNYHNSGKEKILKLTTDKKGYLSVGLIINGVCKINKVHRLVAKAFIPNPNKYPEVNHINYIRDDNRIENLEWVTSKMNNDYSYHRANIKRPRGEKHHTSKLTKEQVLEIRSKYHPKTYNTIKLAKEYNVHKSNIAYIIERKIWTHI